MNFHATLMHHAASTDNPTVLALAGVLASAFERDGVHVLPIRGLDVQQTQWLLARWFPGAEAALAPVWAAVSVQASQQLSEHVSEHVSQCGSRYDEVEDLVTLFADHVDPRAGTREEATCVAHALACACLGANHLWQDLRLPSRRELSALLGYWYPRLAAKNVHDMKWKKFFYKQLCEREGLFVCKAPSCGVCTDYAHCFGTE